MKILKRHRKNEIREYEDIVPTLTESHEHYGGANPPLVVVTPKLTNMPSKSTKGTSQSTKTMEMRQKSLLKNSLTLTSWLRGFLARHSQLRAKGKDLTTQEELSFLKSQGFSETKDPDIFCLKMLKVYYLTTRAKLSRRFLKFLPTWGMDLNGRFLTARITESPKIGKGCSLSDVLEENVAQKYFLSEKAINLIMDKDKNKKLGYGGADGKRTMIATRQPLRYLNRNQKNIEGDYSFTVDGANTGGIKKGTRIRRLTPTECERLQGFPDGWTEEVSDTQRYKTLGNAVTVNVVREIMKKFKATQKPLL